MQEGRAWERGLLISLSGSANPQISKEMEFLTWVEYDSNFCIDRKYCMKLTNIQQQYILHWGEMGTRWGINRTVAQIHALLFLSPKPLPADEIAETLNVARSNVSTSIRELESWGIARAVHVLGERREHYESMKDVWEMFRVIVEQRKRREVDPTLQLLRRCLAEADEGSAADEYTRERLQSMTEFFEAATSAYGEISQVSSATLRRVLGMRGKIRQLLGEKTK
jgi:DNA-binding transcriptional regulator GbsR (MarR family)